MSLDLNIVASHNFPARVPITLAAFRKAALPSASLSGSVASGDLADGAVTPDQVTPGAFWYGDGTLTSDTYAVTLDPALAALADGVVVAFQADAVCPATPKLNVNSLGAKTIYSAYNVALAAGDIRANQIVEVRYEATLAGWQVISLGNTPHRYATATNPVSVNALVVTFAPTVTALTAIAGKPIYVKAIGENTGAATLAVDGLSATAITKRGDVALAAGDIIANHVCELVYDSTLAHFILLNPVRPAHDNVIVGSSQGLAIANSGGATFTITADEVILRDSAARSYRAATVSETVTPANAGAGGLDTGVLAAGWYFVWLIYNPTTATVDGMISASSTAPTLPSGYTYQAMLGAVYVVSTGPTVLKTQQQLGRRAYINRVNLFAGKAAAAGDTYALLAGADLTAFQAMVPTIAKTVLGVMGAPNGAAAHMAIAGTSSGLGAVAFATTVSGLVMDDFSCCAPFECPLVTSQNFYWKADDTSGRNQLDITGYTI